MLGLKEEIGTGCERWLGEGGGYAHFTENGIVFISDSADELGPSTFDRAKEFRAFHG